MRLFTLLGFIVLLLASIPGLAQVADGAVPSYGVVNEKSYLRFKVVTKEKTIQGRFSHFESTIAFDPDRLEKSRIRIEVPLESIVIDDEKTREALLSEEWLAAKLHPRAVFESEKIDKIPGTGDFYADGTLTLHGISKPVTLNFRKEYADDRTGVVSGYATIQRPDFQVGSGQWQADDTVKHAVRVEFRIYAVKN